MVGHKGNPVLSIAAIVLLAATVSGTVHSQQTPAAGSVAGGISDPRPRRIVVYVSSPDEVAASLNVLGESAVSVLAGSGNQVLVRLAGQSALDPVRRRGGFAALEYDQLEQLTRNFGGDAYLMLDLRTDNPGIMDVRWRIGDLLQAVEYNAEYRTPLVSARDLEARAWLPVVEAVQQIVLARDQVVTLRLRGVPMTHILIHPSIRFDIDETGEAALRLPVPGEYTIESQRAGYRSQTQFISLQAATTVNLDQIRRPIAFVQASLFNAQFPELSVGFMPNRGRAYFGVFVTFFQFGLALREQGTQGEQSGFSVSVPLTHLGLSAGYLFGRDQHRTRAYLGLQPFLRLAGGDEITLEDDAAFGAALNLGLEYRVAGNGSVFFEWTPIAYPIDGREAGEELYQGNPGTVVVPLDRALLELTLMRVGYRHRF